MRLFILLAAGSIALMAAQPETVMVTFRVKSGAEAELQRVIARHWTTGRQMKLMSDAPHLTLRGTEEGGKTYFVEIFTWADEKTPDNAPAAIQEIWGDMNRLVEARGGHPGLEFVATSPAEPASRVRP
jgi:hypothetical protein